MPYPNTKNARCLDWQQSLMGIVETSLAHIPIYFDIFSNLTVVMDYSYILDVLNIKILTKGYNSKSR